MYAIAILPSAFRALLGYSWEVKAAIDDRILALANDPHPRSAVQVRILPGRWRVRVGQYRIIYRVEEAARLVVVERIAHRSRAYDSDFTFSPR